MTTPKPMEHVFKAELFAQPPKPGDYFVDSRSGKTLFSVNKVRRGADGKGYYRLCGMRVRHSDLPENITALPWPEAPKRRQPPPSPRTPQSITTQAERQKAERKRVVQARRAAQDPNHQIVDQVRLLNGTAESADWVDPDDISPNRRVPRKIHGVRATDVIERLLTSDSINKKQAKAAKRFRTIYEKGSVGFGLGARDLSAPPCGFSSGTPPSEARLSALLAYRETADAIGPRQLAALMAIIIRGETIQNYAARTKRSRSGMAGYLGACFDALSDWFDKVDEKNTI